jgi:hypothetical protein
MIEAPGTWGEKEGTPIAESCTLWIEREKKSSDLCWLVYDPGIISF